MATAFAFARLPSAAKLQGRWTEQASGVTGERDTMTCYRPTPSGRMPAADDVRVLDDGLGQKPTLVVGDPNLEAVCEETAGDVLLMKDGHGRIICFDVRPCRRSRQARAIGGSQWLPRSIVSILTTPWASPCEPSVLAGLNW